MPVIHARHALTPDGWVDGLAVTIGADGRITRIADGGKNVTGAVDLLLPAPVNLHSHAFQRAMAGLTETRSSQGQDSFWTWRQVMYRFLGRLTPDHVEAIASLAFMEMLEAGYGAVAEFHYLHHGADGTPYANPAEMSQRIIAAAARTGIGLTLLPVLYMQGGCDGRALAGGQRRFGCSPELYGKLLADIADTTTPSDFNLGIAPHSLRAVSPAGLKLAQTMPTAQSAKPVIHMHIAEQSAEVDEVKASLGARPVEWLLANAAVSDRWCLIHCTQMTEAETKALAGTGAVAGLCPITESNLGDGIFNATEFHAAGGAFGVGSDSNIHIALWQELATLEYSQRLRHRKRVSLASGDYSTGRTLFDRVAKAGAQAGGRACGQIGEGQLADLMAVATDNHWLCNRKGDAVLDSLIFSGHGDACVTDVWSAGRHVVTAGRHIGRDAIVADFRKVMQKLEA